MSIKFTARAIWLVLAISADSLAQDAPAPLSAADIDSMFNTLSNWGRWGTDDQRGTLNLVTPEKRRQAASLVKEGISVSLAQDFPQVQERANQAQMQMTMTAGAGTPVAMDEWQIFYHGLTYAHMD